ncbi:ATP-binding cassette domain-containing protein [Microbacterium sp. UFMG61]|uniref:ATP-binding cassette domain-containing protein n=1 Tax=Microbacterium sp. UFMG61 TaxID=2745935 RepID=UPI001E3C0A67|nr:ATP-binding cassette domain-containing protein [Microbacterium sp. UFMG61]
MPDGQVLEFTRVTKRFNEVTAVSDFSARIEPGAVTAFLGPNGAGKTTSLRILLGQVRATTGTATIGGAAYSELRHPLRTIGAVLEETVYRPRRSAARQLTISAKANGIPLSRVDEVLSLVGLENEADGRIGSFSLGMRQRLSVAHALLGDPGALVFDEPANGLDPEGIRWMRLLMRRLADEGRTVLVSSHVLSEIEQVADNVLVLSRGQLMLSSGIETLADPSSGAVVVDAADRVALTAALSAAGFEVEVLRSGLTVRGGDAGTVGAIAADAGIALTTLVQRGPTLEDIFIELVRGGKHAPRALATAPVVVPPVVIEDAAEAESTDAVGGGEDAESEGEGVEPAGGDTVDSETDGVAAASERDAEEADAEEADAEEADAEEALASDADASTPQPSFDDILFGTATETAVTERSSDSAEPGTDEHEGVDVSTAPGADDSASDEEEPGTGEYESDANDSDTHDADTHDAGESDADDPRSAAVSSMLAAAARAYYEDEPKQYPFGEGETDAAPEAEEPVETPEGEH